MNVNLLLTCLLVGLLVLAGCTGTITGVTVSDLPEEQVAPEEPACTETDDGIDPYTKGLTKGVDVEGIARERKDKCIPPFLIEYYCEDGIVKNQNARCEYACYKGECLSPEELEDIEDKLGNKITT